MVEAALTPTLALVLTLVVIIAIVMNDTAKRQEGGRFWGASMLMFLCLWIALILTKEVML